MDKKRDGNKSWNKVTDRQLSELADFWATSYKRKGGWFREGVAWLQFLRPSSEWKLWGWIWPSKAGVGSVQRKRMEDEEARVWTPIVPGVSTYKRHYGRAAARLDLGQIIYCSSYACTELPGKDDRWPPVYRSPEDFYDRRSFQDRFILSL